MTCIAFAGVPAEIMQQNNTPPEVTHTLRCTLYIGPRSDFQKRTVVLDALQGALEQLALPEDTYDPHR